MKQRLVIPQSLVVLCVLIASLALLPGRSLAQAAQRPAAGGIDSQPTYLELLERAQVSTSVAVIVGLALPTGFEPEGALTPSAVEAQRTAIATLRQALIEKLRGYKATVTAVYRTVPYVALRVDKSALKVLASSPLVASIQEDFIDYPLLGSSTAHIGLPPVWAEGVEGAGQAVVLLDQGIETGHPFFGGRVVDAACFSNAGGTAAYASLCPNGQGIQLGPGAAEAGVSNPACWHAGSPLCSHGTWVAGIAAGGDSNTFDGVARRADIIPIQVFTRFDNYVGCGGGTCALAITSDQIRALEYVYTTLRYDHPIAAVSLSLGGGLYGNGCDSDSRKPIIDNLRSVGIATVISAGNNGSTNALTAPGCVSTAVTAGGITDTDSPPADTVVFNMHSLVDLLAPAQGVTSSAIGGGYATASGTSIAAPMVAGAFALCKSVHPSLTADQIETILETTGILVTDTRPGGLHTKPRLQMEAAIAVCRRTTTWRGSHSAAWDDPDNWSDGAVPTSTSDVTIPVLAAGGQYPILNTSASAHALIVQSGARLALAGHTLTVEGDLVVQAGGQFDPGGGKVVLRGVGEQGIGLSEGSNVFDLQIGDSGSGPIVRAEANLGLLGNLTIFPGAVLDLGYFGVTVEGTVANNGTLRQAKVVAPGTSRFLNITNAAGNAAKYWGVDITTVHDLAATTVSVSGNQLCPGAGEGAVRRCFDISPEVEQAASVTFYYRSAEANNNLMPMAWHWDGSAWAALLGSQGGSGDALWVSIPAVDTYSSFLLQDTQPLAANIVYFEAESEPGQVRLAWETTSEIDLLGFTIYRSDGSAHPPRALAFVPSPAPGATGGAVYTYADSGVGAGQSYRYWLEALSLAGMPVMAAGPVQVTYAP